ncbi:MAG: protein TolQ [Gammaproteobacteria bacterium]|nr:protein TolQ [Gammaproteobacteria bacterium]MCP5137930.1 protein TolQ [Gammaproteobacteria bacterium]
MQADLSILQLMLEASPVVQLVMLALLGASVMSWAMIFRKRRLLKLARTASDDFELRFWSGSDLVAMYTQISERRRSRSGMEGLFEAGFKEFARLRKQSGVEPMSVVAGSQRAMRVALARETDYLETNLNFLATVGSTSPYVGLFGTVWGIMSAFRAIGAMQNATLSVVAPGIAEALVATAMGLFAAIPAVIAYNRYTNDVDRLINRYDTFVEEFSSILQRQAHLRHRDADAHVHDNEHGHIKHDEDED